MASAIVYLHQGHAMRCLFSLLLLATCFSALSVQAGEGASRPSSSASLQPLTREQQTQRQQEQAVAEQQESVVKERVRREKLTALAEAQETRVQELRRTKAHQDEEKREKIKWLEETAQLKEGDRRQQGEWKQELGRERALQGQAMQRDRGEFKRWQLAMQEEGRHARLQAMSESAQEKAMEKAMEKQWRLEQWATRKQMEQEQVGKEASARAMEKREVVRLREEERRLLLREQAVASSGKRAVQAEGVNTPEQRVAVLKKSAGQGNAHAQYQLGMAYFAGEGVFQSYEKGVQWLKKAAAQGDARAKLQIGRAYQLGLGLPQDYLSAYLWSHRAALGGAAGAAGQREAIAAQMSASQLERAQKMLKVGDAR
ncbi:MAG: hypothetical protein H7836_11675 [Magnetococcus sp. YQC-3]